MRRPLGLLLALSLYSGHAGAGDLTDGGWDESLSDSLIFVVPLTAFGIAYFKDDSDGKRQWLSSTGYATAANALLKLAFNETNWGERPNDKAYGFPSGHAAAVVSGAAFLWERYGWKYGLPAYAASSFVFYQRINDRKHKWRDVIGGAAVAWVTAEIVVSSYDEANKGTELALVPIVGSEEIGMRLDYRF